MKIIGLTGSIATGKSTLIQQIQQNLRWPVWDADVQVHRLYKTPSTLHQLIQAFPETAYQTHQGPQVNRTVLKQILTQDPALFDVLEAILHPALAIRREIFLKTMRLYNQKVVVLDIPLLFETNLHLQCHFIVLTHCPESLQRNRILRRPSMTHELMEHLLLRHIPFHKKKHFADIIVETGLNKRHSWNSFIYQMQKMEILR